MRALAYDWLGRTLYFAGRVERSGGGRVGVWVPRLNGDGADEIFVGDSLEEGEGMRLAVDPFRGYVMVHDVIVPGVGVAQVLCTHCSIP